MCIKRVINRGQQVFNSEKLMYYAFRGTTYCTHCNSSTLRVCKISKVLYNNLIREQTKLSYLKDFSSMCCVKRQRKLHYITCCSLGTSGHVLRRRAAHFSGLKTTESDFGTGLSNRIAVMSGLRAREPFLLYVRRLPCHVKYRRMERSPTNQEQRRKKMTAGFASALGIFFAAFI